MKPRLRAKIGWLLKTMQGRVALLVLLCGLFSWAWWYNIHRTIGWGQTFNPVYWYHRWRGDDLYIPSQALLLHGNRALHEVALTFDDGPHPESLPSILATLQRFHVHATFFDVGENMAKWPWLVKQTLQEGNEVGDHSSTHLRFLTLSPEELHHEINDADITFCRITGQHMHLLRPPGMDYNNRVLKVIRNHGYITVSYNTASRDFSSRVTPAFIADRTLDRVENGSIILLHDYPGTASALPAILQGLQKQGYRMVTVSHMLADLPQRQRRPALAFERAQTDPLRSTDSTAIRDASAQTTPE